MDIAVKGKTLIIITPPNMTLEWERKRPPDLPKIFLLIDGMSRVEIDMSSTRGIDRHGVATIMSIGMAATSRNTKFTVVNTDDSVKSMLQIANCHKLFAIY